MTPFRVRMITNLDCNFNCTFCYQRLKLPKILPIEEVKELLGSYEQFERCSIMGGEATLLRNLDSYIREASKRCSVVGLTTNGSLLDRKRLIEYRDAGLQELAFSISSLKRFNEVTNRDCLSTVLKNLDVAKSIIRNTRVNITQNDFNIGDEIYEMIEFFNKRGLFVVICEDICRNFKMKFEEKLGARLASEEFGFRLYEYCGGRFGFFKDYTRYDDTDIIISPVGTFTKWREYCRAVGLKPGKVFTPEI